MSKHNRPQPLPSIGPAPKKSFLEKCREEWLAISAIATFIGIVGTGTLKLSGFWGTKADAVSVSLHEATVDVRIGSAEKRLDKLETTGAILQVEYDHLHEDILGIRQDYRDVLAHKPLPALTPEPGMAKPEKTP